MFETFKSQIINSVLQNLLFQCQINGTHYISFDDRSQNVIRLFLQESLNALPKIYIDALQKLNENDLESLIQSISGNRRQERQFNTRTGDGLHFSGLSKLCFNAAEPYTTHPLSHFLTQQDKTKTLFQVSYWALKKITHPLKSVAEAFDILEPV